MIIISDYMDDKFYEIFSIFNFLIVPNNEITMIFSNRSLIQFFLYNERLTL